MKINIIVLLLIALVSLSSCKYFRDNTYQEKRRPMYNKKYINVAKRNVLEEKKNGTFDLDVGDEIYAYNDLEDFAMMNRQMYLDITKEEEEEDKNKSVSSKHSAHKKKIYDKYKKSSKNKKRPSFKDNYSRLENDQQDANYQYQQMIEQLAEVKHMLNEAKEDLSTYRCAPLPVNSDHNQLVQESNDNSAKNNNIKSQSKHYNNKPVKINAPHKLSKHKKHSHISDDSCPKCRKKK
ncbi:MAG: hypothetical protein AB8B67_03560 [Rickettsiaceae bacterium]